MRKTTALIFIISILGVYSFSKDFLLIIPKGFPQPEIPEDNQLTQAKVDLGKKLFFDTIMSRDTTVSCATCHIPEFAFTDRLPKSIGIRGQEVSRNSPTLTNVVYNEHFLLDGVNTSLESQVIAPIQEHTEFDFHVVLIAERLKRIPEYVDLCLEAYNSEPTPFAITHAIASFERTLISGNSPYDKYVYQDQQNALNDSELRGMDLFMNKLYCNECHSGFNFTNQGLTNNGLYETYADSGRMRLTNLETDRAVFKVPTLRNIGVTYPYMHDGSFETLNGVIQHYSTGGKNHKNKSDIIKPFDLSPKEKEDLIAFLHSLTDSSFLSFQE
jgi:cytochrome c peroxidase